METGLITAQIRQGLQDKAKIDADAATRAAEVLMLGVIANVKVVL